MLVEKLIYYEEILIQFQLIKFLLKFFQLIYR